MSHQLYMEQMQISIRPNYRRARQPFIVLAARWSSSQKRADARAFVCEELMVIPEDTKVLPEEIAEWKYIDVFKMKL